LVRSIYLKGYASLLRAAMANGEATLVPAKGKSGKVIFHFAIGRYRLILHDLINMDIPVLGGISFDNKMSIVIKQILEQLRVSKENIQAVKKCFPVFNELLFPFDLFNNPFHDVRLQRVEEILNQLVNKCNAYYKEASNSD
jgi:hypothetical protein